MKKQPIAAVVVMIAFFFSCKTVLYAQTHASVPVDHAVYYILDQAEARGLCSALPAVKPFTRGKILEIISEILNAEPKRFGGLNDKEREILENARAEFGGGKAGFDPWKGKYRFDTTGKKSVRFSMDVGLNMESLNSAAYYLEQKDKYFGTDTWGTLFVRGDVGEHFSFGVDFSGGLLKANRVELGDYYPFATQLERPTLLAVNEPVTTYGQPAAFFPYTYKRNWDGFMFHLGGSMSAGGMEYWPENISIAAKMVAEMSGSLFGDMLLVRFGRLRREWGGMAPGSSLVLNGAARPFIGIETNFNPIPWFAYSSVTGVLEYDNSGESKEPALTFQNAYSLQQVDINIKNYFHIDLGSAVVWTKRWEFGYIFPLIDNFFYQNFIGDYDNTAVFMNIKGQYPGIGKIWFSFFMDEVEISSIKTIFNRDRHTFAYQAGLQGVLPFSSFTSITASYTKIEPYNYTHHRGPVPWYGDRLMETAYVNNGASLGYYLPPNSDEIKVRFETRPLSKTACHLQYQLVRHGADYGPHQVDGSSLVSQLDPEGRGSKESLRKNFLKDGAYQWMHIVKIGAEHTLKKLSLTFFGEAGIAYSYFTDISDEEYAKYTTPTPDGQPPRPAARGAYSKSTAFILTLGFKIFK